MHTVQDKFKVEKMEKDIAVQVEEKKKEKEERKIRAD
jgi:hypothetical protein